LPRLTSSSYLQMVSVGIDGGTDIVYSARFGLTGMTGVFTALQQQGVTAAGSDTSFVPPAAHQLVTAVAGAGTAAAAPVTGMFDVAYNQQTGLIKYAPMQPIPGTKITAKTPTPLNPTSAFTIFKTYAPPASVTFTVTESQTMSHSSYNSFPQYHANKTAIQASAATQPTAADMKRYLNRWRD
jgi:hypothetical protein